MVDQIGTENAADELIGDDRPPSRRSPAPWPSWSWLLGGYAVTRLLDPPGAGQAPPPRDPRHRRRLRRGTRRYRVRTRRRTRPPRRRRRCPARGPGCPSGSGCTSTSPPGTGWSPPAATTASTRVTWCSRWTAEPWDRWSWCSPAAAPSWSSSGPTAAGSCRRRSTTSHDCPMAWLSTRPGATRRTGRRRGRRPGPPAWSCETCAPATWWSRGAPGSRTPSATG